MEFGSKSDTVSVCGSNRNTDDLYSSDGINNFLDVTFKKSGKLKLIEMAFEVHPQCKQSDLQHKKVKS